MSIYFMEVFYEFVSKAATIYMKICSSFNTDRNNNTYQSFKGVPPNPKYIPEFIGNLGKLAGEYINTPEQKLFLAISALTFQPLIDLKYAQDDKKIDASIKSASKAMAGGFTGVVIRAAFLKITNHFIGFNKHNKLNRLFMPDDAVRIKLYDPDMAQLRIKQYSQTLGTLFAVLFMILFSNAKVDVPLTSDLQDIISGIVKQNKSWLRSINDVANNRGKKISSWFKQKGDIFKNIKNKFKDILNVILEKPEETKGKESKK